MIYRNYYKYIFVFAIIQDNLTSIYESGYNSQKRIRRMSRQWLSPEEIAEELGLKSAETVRGWIRRRELPATKLGNRVYRVKREDLDRFLEERRTKKDD